MDRFLSMEVATGDWLRIHCRMGTVQHLKLVQVFGSGQRLADLRDELWNRETL